MPLYNSDISVNVDSHPGFKPGSYYIHTPVAGSSSNNNVTFTPNCLVYTPLFLEKKVSIDRLVIRSTSSVVGSLARIGIYGNSTQGIPNNLLVDAGEFDMNSVAFKEAIVDITLNAGWYWLAGNCNIAPNILISTNALGSLHYVGFSSPQIANTGACYAQISVPYGVLPIIAPVNNLSVRPSIPLFWFRAK